MLQRGLETDQSEAVPVTRAVLSEREVLHVAQVGQPERDVRLLAGSLISK